MGALIYCYATRSVELPSIIWFLSNKRKPPWIPGKFSFVQNQLWLYS